MLAVALPIVCPLVALAIKAVAGFCKSLPVNFNGAPSKNPAPVPTPPNIAAKELSSWYFLIDS